MRVRQSAMINSFRTVCICGFLVATLSACADPTTETLIKPWTVLWEIPGEVRTQPLVVDSLVIVAFQDGRLTAFQRASGAVVWQRRFQGEIFGERMLRHGEILVVPEYALHGVNVRTGALLWSYGGPKGTAGVSTPAMAGDVVYAADYNPGRAAALDVNTGALLWTVDLDATLFTPNVSDDLVLYPTRKRLGANGEGGLGAGDLIALDRITGEEHWRFYIPDSAGFFASGGTTNAGLVVGDRVIFGSRSSRIFALRLSDGGLIWEQTGSTPVRAWYHHAPVLFDGAAVLVRADGVLEARATDDGSIVWSTSLSSYDTKRPDICAPYLCLAFGRVWVVDRAGSIAWEHGGSAAGVVYLSAPAIDSDGVMYIGTVRGLSDTRFLAFMPPITLGPTD